VIYEIRTGHAAVNVSAPAGCGSVQRARTIANVCEEPDDFTFRVREGLNL